MIHLTPPASFRFSDEPVVWVAAVNALIALGLAFGVPIDPEQKAAIDGVVLALSALFLREQVSPASHLPPTPPTS